MNKDELTKRLMVTFLVEIEEHIRALNQDLLAIEQDPAGRPDLITTLFRSVHSLKGAARAVDLGLIESVCHQVESILVVVRDGQRPMNSDLIQLFFTAVDALKDAGNRLKAKQELDVALLTGVVRRLQASSLAQATAEPPPEMQREAPHAGEAEPPPILPPDQSLVVRVPAEKLDALLRGSGELLVARSRSELRREDVRVLQESYELTLIDWKRAEKPLRKIARTVHPAHSTPSRREVIAIDRTQENLKKIGRNIERLSTRLASDRHLIEQAARALEDEVRRVRMLPFGTACEGLARMVRDLSRAAGKEVDLVVEGGDVELDRSILESLTDPLKHLVRNALDHGIELPEARQERGKPARGRILISASLRGADVEIVVQDDGVGLNLEAIRAQGLKKSGDAPKSERELAQLVFQPGFSTAQFITALSGRGMGLDVVKHRVESVHGLVDLSFEPGRGSRFSLIVPLTITTIRALLLVCGGQTFALPATSVRRLFRAGPSDLGSVEGREVLLGGAAPTPVLALTDILTIPAGDVRRAGGKATLAVVGSGDNQVAFVVDEFLAEEEFVVKSLGPRFRTLPYFSGATVLSSGRIALILNAANLVAAALRLAPGASLAAALIETAPTAKKRLLVVDDSVTTRSLEKSILEAAGYEVLVAPDGMEAWHILQEKGADLIVSDVEMPRMDGFALTEAIRASKRFAKLPVILVTALESPTDRTRGLEAGADAYLPKSTFDQSRLLETIAQLI